MRNGFTTRVGIVVLNWNGKDDTLECVRSIYQSSFSNRDVVVVDNGSTDDSVDAIRHGFSEVEVIETGCNLGYAEGNNLGIRRALAWGAKYIFLLNNDAVLDSAAIENLVLAAEASPNVGVFSPKIYWYSKPNVIWFAGAKWAPEKAAFDHVGSGEEDKGDKYTAVCEIDYASGSALFFRAEVATQIGLFDPRFFLMWEETDWCYRARRHGFDVMLEPSAKVWHKVSNSFEGGWQGAESQYYLTRNRLLWIEKNLRGQEQIHAFIRCFRELYWWRIESRRPHISGQRQAILRARLLGGWHYFIRRFGSGPAPSHV